MPEKPSSSPRHTSDAAEAREKKLSDRLNSFEDAVGPAYVDGPKIPTEKDLNDAERTLNGDNVYDSFSEAFRVNELIQQRSMLQRENDIKKNGGSPDDRFELSTSARSVTYHRYFPSIVHDIADSMRRYEALKATIDVVPIAVQQKEAQAELYMAELGKMLRERTAFANVVLAQGKMAKHAGNTGELIDVHSKLMEGNDLSDGSKAVLQKGDPARIKQKANELNQHIIDILSGKQKIPGVDEGFFPEQVHLDLLIARFVQILEEEKRIVKDQDSSKAKKRMAELEEWQEKAKAGDAEPLTKEELAEHARLRAQLGDRKATLDTLAIQQEEILKELLSFTQALGKNQLERAELATLQAQFGEEFAFEGASMPNPDQTPDEIRKKMQSQMEMRSEFHLERMESFLNVVEEEILDVGTKEWVEHLNNKHGREAMRDANHVITNIVTSVLPTTMGLRDHVRESLTGPLDQALGWPPGKTEWSELTPEEQKVVLDKSQSIKQAVDNFDRKKIDDLQSTISLIRSMPDASAFGAEDVKQPLPTERITDENLQQMIDTHGGATVYTMLFLQADKDFGAGEPASGFLGEYGTFLHAVNKNIGGHIKVGDALLDISNMWTNVRNNLLLAAGAIFLLGILGGALLLRPALRAAGKTARFGARMTVEGVKKTANIVRSTQKQLSELSKARTASKGAQALEKSVESASKMSKLGRFLARLGIIAAAADLRRVTFRDAGLIAPEKMERVVAGIELMEQHGNKGSTGDAAQDALTRKSYDRDLGYLHDQREALVMEDGAIKIVQHILSLYSENDQVKNVDAEKLIERGVQLQFAAQDHAQEFHQLFPITDYFVKNPEGEPGNIGFNVRDIDQARPRGVDYARVKDGIGNMLLDNPDEKLSSDAMTSEEVMNALKKGDSIESIGARLSLEKARESEDLTHFPYFREAYERYLENAADFLKE